MVERGSREWYSQQGLEVGTRVVTNPTLPPEWRALEGEIVRINYDRFRRPIVVHIPLGTRRITDPNHHYCFDAEELEVPGLDPWEEWQG